MTTTTVRVNLQYELEDYNVFTKKKPVIVDMQSVRFGLYYEYLLDLIVNWPTLFSVSPARKNWQKSSIRSLTLLSLSLEKKWIGLKLVCVEVP